MARFSEVMTNAFEKALSGGMRGNAAQVANVLALMWLRTIMNYQYRYGGELVQTITKFYEEGGISRFYCGLVPALIQAPWTRFSGSVAYDGAMYVFNLELPIQGKPLLAKACKHGLSVLLNYPLDAWKTIMAVEGAEGLHILIEKFRKDPTALWQGWVAGMIADRVGYSPSAMTSTWLRHSLPSFDFKYGNYVRNAVIGVCAASVNDICSNSFRILKTTVQTSVVPISYMDAANDIISNDGLSAILFRGLPARILTNGLQAAIFTVGWRSFEEFFAECK